MVKPGQNHKTLAVALAALSLNDHIFILHRLGPHELEAVGGGTVQEMKDLRCVEVCGDNLVERIELVTDEPQPEWMGASMPVWVITIGGKNRWQSCLRLCQ